MKRTKLQRRTPLRRAKSPDKRRKPKTRTKPKQPSLRLLKKKLWAECKRITRARYGNTCFTCGKHPLEGAGWQTGHFIPSSVCSTEIRYDLDNLRPQCWRCNINLSGNWIEYEKRLGPELVADLKRRNEETKGRMYRADWYEAKIAEYRELST